MIYTSTVTQKGQATIPVEVRRLLGVSKNNKILFRLENGSVILEKQPDISEMFGILKPKKLKKPLSNNQIHKMYERHIVSIYKAKATKRG